MALRLRYLLLHSMLDDPVTVGVKGKGLTVSAREGGKNKL